MHPILDSLDNTPHEWIKKLLFTFNEGNIGKFESLAPLFPKEVCVSKLRSCFTCSSSPHSPSYKKTTHSCDKKSA